MSVACAPGCGTAERSGAVPCRFPARFPTDEVYYPTLTPRLRLVTCGGSFDPVAHSYRSNVIVFARLAG